MRDATAAHRRNHPVDWFLYQPASIQSEHPDVLYDVAVGLQRALQAAGRRTVCRATWSVAAALRARRADLNNSLFCEEAGAESLQPRQIIDFVMLEATNRVGSGVMG